MTQIRADWCTASYSCDKVSYYFKHAYWFFKIIQLPHTKNFINIILSQIHRQNFQVRKQSPGEMAGIAYSFDCVTRPF